MLSSLPYRNTIFLLLLSQLRVYSTPHKSKQTSDKVELVHRRSQEAGHEGRGHSQLDGEPMHPTPVDAEPNLAPSALDWPPTKIIPGDAYEPVNDTLVDLYANSQSTEKEENYANSSSMSTVMNASKRLLEFPLNDFVSSSNVQNACAALDSENANTFDEGDERREEIYEDISEYMKMDDCYLQNSTFKIARLSNFMTDLFSANIIHL
jgi:hypothetical protein